MGIIKDIEDVLLALQVKQSKYKYDFITESIYNQKTKTISKKYSLVKYHKEDIYDSITGQVKRLRIEDRKLKGGTIALLDFLVDELSYIGDS